MKIRVDIDTNAGMVVASTLDNPSPQSAKDAVRDEVSGHAEMPGHGIGPGLINLLGGLTGGYGGGFYPHPYGPYGPSPYLPPYVMPYGPGMGYGAAALPAPNAPGQWLVRFPTGVTSVVTFTGNAAELSTYPAGCLWQRVG